MCQDWATRGAKGKTLHCDLNLGVLASEAESPDWEKASLVSQNRQQEHKWSPSHKRLSIWEGTGLPTLEWVCGDLGRCRNALKVSDHNQQEGEKASTQMLGQQRFCYKTHSQVLRERESKMRPTWTKWLPKKVQGSLPTCLGACVYQRWPPFSELALILVLLKLNLSTSALPTLGAG